MGKRIGVSMVQALVGTGYPAPFDEPCLQRERRRLGDTAGLTQFGVNMTRLAPGAWSSQRHWHSHGDEFIYIVSGEVLLVTDDGEEVLRTGDAAGFRAGEPNGHHLQNRSEADAVVLEVGARHPADTGIYPDIDMVAPAGQKPAVFTHKDGTPYPDKERH